MVEVHIATATSSTGPQKFSKGSRARSGLRSSMATWFQKVRVGIRKMSDVFTDSSGSESGSRTVEALFDGDTEVPLEKVTEQDLSICDRSSTAVTVASQYVDNVNMTMAVKEEDGSRLTFDNYDVTKHCETLRSNSNPPFTAGPDIWALRRKLWSAESVHNTRKEAEVHRANFSKIRSQYYPRIYRKLVVDDLPLNQPINLSDAMKIIDAGWIEIKRWERASKGLG